MWMEPATTKPKCVRCCAGHPDIVYTLARTPLGIWNYG